MSQQVTSTKWKFLVFENNF